MKSISEHSAGGIVYRQGDKGQAFVPSSGRGGIRAKGKQIEWLICKHSGYHKWTLPKGIIEEGETLGETATREVKEETGVAAKILKKITPDVRYTYTKNDILVNKRVEFFLMEYVLGDIKNHSWEMEKVKWATEEKALKLLAFETERKILKKAIKLT